MALLRSPGRPRGLRRPRPSRVGRVAGLALAALTASFLLTGCEGDDKSPAPSVTVTGEPGGGPSTTGAAAPKP